MFNKSAVALVAISASLFQSYICQAQEILVENDKNVTMVVSIYNNNLGFVRDTRKVNLKMGANAIAFEGVASQIKPETAMLTGLGVNVTEQNYDYNLLTPNNILDEYIGKMVKTAVYNEKTGETTFGTAKVVNSNYGSPILQFDYGVEPNFPGRIVYEKVPANLRVKPTLVASLNNKNAGEKNLELAYLTNGISWKADYIAEVKSEKELNIQTWITLNNETGADYDNAKVQLISGSVNQVEATPMPRQMRVMAKANMESFAMAGGMADAGVVQRSNISDYYLYDLPGKTTIKDKQSKQVSLMNLANVTYKKEYLMQSPLYVGLGAAANEFTKQNPNVVFKLVNDKESKLGVPMPSGVMRFYEKGSQENLQFIGESNIEQSASGEKIDLTIGKAFDIFATGKVKNVKVISKNMNEVESEVTFNNATDKAKEIVFEQNINNSWEILNESAKSERKNASTAKWSLNVPAKGKTVLTFNVRVYRNQ